ncbi:MAG TPA: zinc ribbon domain-containing protein [Candidatus Limnocylindrales bacterium]
MTDDTRTICKRCGFTNIPGDQFCGSCGTFLEWDGVPAEGATTAVDAAPPPDPQPSAPVAAPPPDDQAGYGDLVRCPACGTANASSRTFCQSCGATLAAAERVEAASPEQIAQAVAWTSAPGTKAGPTTKTAGGDASSGSRGIPSWIVWVGVIGVLVGVAIVLGGLALRGENPGTGATGSVRPSGPASSDGPGSSGPGDSTAPGTAVPIPLSEAEASSTVAAKFQANKAIDGDPDTSWQEGKGQEKGEWIEVTFDSSRADTLLIRNGYGASQALFKGNRRLKDVEVSVNGGAPIAVRLKDVIKEQEVDLGGVSGATSVRITIVSTYPGQKTSVADTPFDDAAVSEISVLGVPGG